MVPDFPLPRLDRTRADALHEQLQASLAELILRGVLPPGSRLPAARQFARRLAVARNTVNSAYAALVDQGYVTARPRSGHVVNDGLPDVPVPTTSDPGDRVSWAGRFHLDAVAIAPRRRSIDWQRQPFPFVYGQPDPGLFPLAAWRECSRQALGATAVEAWAPDRAGSDDPALIEALIARVLPRRGVIARQEEVLVTMGSQHALYLIARILAGPGVEVGVEEPGYPDFRAILALTGATVRPLPVDADGLAPGSPVDGVGLLFVTPSHQFPTTTTMSIERRLALITRAEAADTIVIEDDYECETAYLGSALPALKSLDRSGRVIYVGTFSKAVAPGVRLGYLVADPDFVAQARALRRLEMRQPPANNQRAMALFIASGQFDALVGRLTRAYRERSEAMGNALDRHRLGGFRRPRLGGSCYWIAGPDGLDAGRFAEACLDRGVVIEPGASAFAASDPPLNHFRLGFSAIDAARIEPGIERLAGLMHQHLG